MGIILDRMECLEKNGITGEAEFIEFYLSRYLIDQGFYSNWAQWRTKASYICCN